MNIMVTYLASGQAKVEVQSDLGKTVVSLEVGKSGEERDNNDQDYMVVLKLAGEDPLYADQVTVGSWGSSSRWQGAEA